MQRPNNEIELHVTSKTEWHTGLLTSREAAFPSLRWLQLISSYRRGNKCTT